MRIEAQIREEQDRATIEKKLHKARDILRTLQSAWPQMSEQERQTVCQELIDRVVLHRDGVIDVHLKLRSYLLQQEKA